MTKYYQNKETGVLVGLTNDGRVIEFQEVKSGAIVDARKEPESVGGGVDHKRPYHRRDKESQNFTAGKVKKEKKVNWRTLAKMKELKKAGYNSGQIAEELGLQLETVNKSYPKL